MSEEIKEFSPVATEVAPPRFDPTKKYTWDSNDVFTITGEEFGLILNSLRAVMSTPEARALFMAAEAADRIESLLVKNVENGKIKETPEVPKGSI